jgi:hypothetical protein
MADPPGFAELIAELSLAKKRMAAMEARLTILRKGDDPTPDGYPSLGATRGTN